MKKEDPMNIELTPEQRDKFRNMRRQSDTHITVTRNGKKLIDNGQLTAFGKRIMDINDKEKEKLRKELCARDGSKCHYCKIREEDFLRIWKGFYGEKRGRRLEIDRKDNRKGYNAENCVLACSICNNAKSDKLSYEEFLKVGAVIKQIWQTRKKRSEGRMNIQKLFSFVLACLFLLPSPAFALDHLYPAKVERVIDGDTLVADLHLGLGVILDNQYVRFYGIDAWETGGEEREKGLKTKEYLVERLEQGNIKIEIRPEWGRDGKGKYGRWLGVPYMDGMNINTELVEEGHAKEMAREN